MAHDPVCGRPVDADGARWMKYGKQLHYFCSRRCSHLFALDPFRYTSLAAIDEARRSLSAEPSDDPRIGDRRGVPSSVLISAT